MDLHYSDGIAAARTMIAVEGNALALQRRLPGGWELAPYAGDDLRGTSLRGANVLTTDVWASMGQEDEREERQRAFAGFCVSQRHMSLAAADVLFLHCLPAHRGEEVEAAVIDGPRSVVWDEAENRLHTQKALLELLCSPVARR